ncbi:M48 family metallopeptidase [Spiribacter halobius]|uniref:Metal-dependent hydrolase n=1 Tax=Sediminicurvatus halobius TaxID=2182432 RepID=A0A2U2N7K4_9GAMM|nr:SprT family zinc-dependent metalloprotease [Spiribacter halobius]PWG65100.1 metal-dependent hydrolase [Spiribacter halobius]UEX78952.1 M48 family metallopeptidase [Spiribacter halobius]
MNRLPAELEVAGQALPIVLRRSRRRTVALHLLPGPELQVRAPRHCPESVLVGFLFSRRGWIQRHLQRLPPPAPQNEYRAGEAHPLLGRAYPLAPLQAPRRRVRLADGRLRVAVPAPGDSEQVARALQAWYRAEAARVFQERLEHWGPLAAARIGTPPAPRLRLRRMRRRWGSCTGSGVVTLNTRLVERCRCLIDYVLVHELCHLRELNHSPRFHALVTELMPDWRTHSEALDRGALVLSPGCTGTACTVPGTVGD